MTVKEVIKKTARGSGEMPIEINCNMCGRPVTVPDRRTKFCPDCRKARKRMFDGNALQKYREAARERRKAIERQNLELIEENRMLREENARLKAVIRNERFNRL